MTGGPQDQFRDALHGIQLGLFEVIWPTLRWIEKIWMKSDDKIQLFIQTSIEPDERKSEDCRRLFNELLDVAVRHHPTALSHARRYQFSLSPPTEEGYVEVMSDNIFRQIAEKHAPWRLERGR
jgi:hypothetical protein